MDAAPLLQALQQQYEVRWIVTPAAAQILAKLPAPAVASGDHAQTYQAPLWAGLGTPIPHIALRDWGDLLLIAPATANTIAKIANGIADNELTTLFLAWDIDRKPVMLAPSMNAVMYRKPMMQKNLDTLRDCGVTVIEPLPKEDSPNGDSAPLTMPPVPLMVQRVDRLSANS
jgi:phosphopantothenoylcysteine synthetase/decarboxylase